VKLVQGVRPGVRPVSAHASPTVSFHLPDRQIQQLDERVVGREVPAVPGDFPKLVVHRLQRVRGVYDFPDLGREGQERNECGLRAGEALDLYVEDLDLSRDNEHISVLGKGGRRRTVLLDDPKLVTLLRHYLKTTGYEHGPLFRAEKNGDDTPIRYQSVHARWRAYCQAAGVTATPHQLRHSHATELVNDNVSLATIRKRLGHRNIQSTLRYAEQSDVTADAELRRWRRRRNRRP
jgi:integrase